MSRLTRRPLLPIVLSTAAMLLALGVSPASALATTDDGLADGIIVTYAAPGSAGVEVQSGDGAPDVDDSLARAGLRVTADLGRVDGRGVVKAEPAAGQTVDEAVADALAAKGVVAAQPNYRYELVDDVDDSTTTATAPPATGAGIPIRLQAAASFDDPIAQYASSTHTPNQYWLYSAHLADAWTKSRADGAVTVAVLDGPVDVTHEDLSANILADQAYDALGDSPHVIDMSTVDASYSGAHSTHVAGIIAGVANNGVGIAGGSYNAKVLPVMVLGNEGSGGSTSTVLAGLQYVRERAAEDNIRVVNLSLRQSGTPTSAADQAVDQAVHDAIRELRDDYGVVTVCAGGNYTGSRTRNHAITDPSYPADYDECVSVTALTASGGNWYASEYNQYKDISAPGYQIWSTWYNPSGYGEVGPYNTKDGTSMAAPMVAATFALLFAEEPSATVDEACQAIYSTAGAIRYDSSNERDRDREQRTGSHGSLNADAAVTYLARLKGYPDVEPGAWYWDGVQFVSHRGLMTGYADGSGLFGVGRSLTRAEFANILWRVAEPQAAAAGTSVANQTGLADVEDYAWYTGAANWAVHAGVISGNVHDDGSVTFDPNAPVTTEQMVTMLGRYADPAAVASASLSELDAFADRGQIDEYAWQSAAWSHATGLVTGYPNADETEYTFRPHEEIPRERTATVLMRAYELGILS